MRILLVGEFSSFHRYLKDGLTALGHEVILAAGGDGWKNIGGADIVFSDAMYRNTLSDRISDFVQSYRIVNQLRDYDVVQFINPKIFRPSFNLFLQKKLIKNNRFIALSCCGGDLAYIEAYENGLLKKYVPGPNDSLVRRYSEKTLSGRMVRRNERELRKYYDVLIPASYEYGVGYDSAKRSEVIPMPVSVDRIEYHENRVKNDKVVLFHGLNREEEKGTPMIRKALARIEKEYKDHVEIVMQGHMPFD